MFSTARCVLSVQPRPCAAVPSRRRAPALTAVSARPRRGGARRDRSWDDDGGGGSSGDEDAVDESFFGDPWDEEEPVEPEEPSGRRRPAASPESAAGQLRGSDVLRALQRAAAAKMEAKKKTKKKAGARPAARRQQKVGGGAETVEIVGEVRPIEIRREWAPRIRELQLLDKHHRRDRSWDNDSGGGGSGNKDTVDESFFGDPWDKEEPVEPEEPSGRRRPTASPELPAGQLRGSDVLRAQRTAAAKMEAKKKTKRKAGARPAARRQQKVGGGAETVEIVGKVRLIEIRREWAPRIRELELRVQQLLDKHHR